MRNYVDNIYKFVRVEGFRTCVVRMILLFHYDEFYSLVLIIHFEIFLSKIFVSKKYDKIKYIWNSVYTVKSKI